MFLVRDQKPWGARASQTDETPPSSPGYRPDIDGLRGIAVLAVVAYHAFPNRLPGGYIGVDIFFVISGYLISSIILSEVDQRRFSFVRFYGRRIRRIFPALTLVLATTVVYAAFVLLPREFESLGKHVAAGAGFVSNFALWADSGYFDAAAERKPLLHLWSLAIEEQFYLLWPLALWLTIRTRRWTGALILALTLISFLANILTVSHDATTAFYSPVTRWWELMIGALLAYRACRLPSAQLFHIRWRDRDIPWRDWQALAGLLLIVVALVVLRPDSAFPGWWALLPTIGAYMVIAAGMAARPNRWLLANRPIVSIGLISYPLYLWHWPLLSFSYLGPDRLSPALRVAVIILALLLAWLTYRLVERPIRFGAWRHISPAAHAGSVAALAAIGGFIYINDGFPARFPENVRAMTNWKFEYVGPYQEGTCFLLPTQPWTAFRECPPPPGASKPALLIWGDSHAAHLLPGYQAVYGLRYSVEQRSASACPPLLGFDPPNRPFCRDINEHILDHISSLRPAKVVLAAAWPTYADWSGLEATVARLRELGIHDIDLVGPVLLWLPNGLPTRLYEEYQRYPRRHVPKRLAVGFDPNVLLADGKLRDLAAQLEVRYHSPTDVLCNTDGCLARLGDAPDEIVTWDISHLTVKGATYLVRHFAEESSQ